MDLEEGKITIIIIIKTGGDTILIAAIHIQPHKQWPQQIFHPHRVQTSQSHSHSPLRLPPSDWAGTSPLSPFTIVFTSNVQFLKAGVASVLESFCGRQENRTRFGRTSQSVTRTEAKIWNKKGKHNEEIIREDVALWGTWEGSTVQEQFQELLDRSCFRCTANIWKIHSNPANGARRPDPPNVLHTFTN